MRDAIAQRKAGLLTYGITPPKRSYAPERRAEVAGKQRDRIAGLPVDGLVIYDLQDESARTDEERPFPFLECIDPVEYAFQDLGTLSVPKIVYRCVAALDGPGLSRTFNAVQDNGGLSVLVGAASAQQQTSLRLSDAYAQHRRDAPGLPLGGVLISERHDTRGDEHERVLRKVERGCSFFITQAVYSVVATKNVLSDLHYTCQKRGLPTPPVLVTLSPCGSTKTLAFMRWLGIRFPRWLENELTHADDILDLSVNLCAEILEDLAEFAASKGIPLGCNVESVSLRRTEIDASVELVHRARAVLSKTVVD